MTNKGCFFLLDWLSTLISLQQHIAATPLSVCFCSILLSSRVRSREFLIFQCIWLLIFQCIWLSSRVRSRESPIFQCIWLSSRVRSRESLIFQCIWLSSRVRSRESPISNAVGYVFVQGNCLSSNAFGYRHVNIYTGIKRENVCISQCLTLVLNGQTFTQH